MDIPVLLRESRSTRRVALLGLVAAIALSVWLGLAVLRSVQQRTSSVLNICVLLQSTLSLTRGAFAGSIHARYSNVLG
jgi:hypothetical protein